MADGFDLHLDQDRADRLRAAADASGMSMTEYALAALDRAAVLDFAEDERRIAEYDRTGQSLGVGEWIKELRASVASARQARA